MITAHDRAPQPRYMFPAQKRIGRTNYDIAADDKAIDRGVLRNSL